MIGRYILPWFGGGPAVWTSCLLFFQACLLAGYAYAHVLGSLGNVRLQAGVHIGLLLGSLAFLPIHPNAAVWKPVIRCRSVRPDLPSANRDSGRSLSAVVRDSAAAAALVCDERIGLRRKIALALICAFEFRIVSCLAELSVRF